MQASNRRRRHLASRKRQGILGSTTAACTSEVLRNVPKRIGSGMPYPTKAWPMNHLWAIFLSVDCCGQQSQPFNQNIGRRIAVPVVVCPTRRTGPLPDREVFRIRVLVPAAAAQLATGEECANLNDLLVLPSRLILQLPAELAPGGICDGLGQGMVSHHPLNIEALYTDDVISNGILGCPLKIYGPNGDIEGHLVDFTDYDLIVCPSTQDSLPSNYTRAARDGDKIIIDRSSVNWMKNSTNAYKANRGSLPDWLSLLFSTQKFLVTQ